MRKAFRLLIFFGSFFGFTLSVELFEFFDFFIALGIGLLD